MNALMKRLAVIATAGILLSGKALGAPSANLKDVIVYPCPFEPALGHTSVTFGNVTQQVRVRIYKITGELVNDLGTDASDGTLAWPATNSEGKEVATGVYLYRVSNDAGEEKTGKLVILK